MRDREAEKFSVPFPHGIDLAFTSMTWSSHASALCKHSSSSPFPSFLLFGSTSGTADTSSCCSSLVSPRPALGSICASYGQHAAGWGEVPHPRCKARETRTHISNGPRTSCPWSGHSSAPLQLGRGSWPGLRADRPVFGTGSGTAIAPARTGSPCRVLPASPGKRSSLTLHHNRPCLSAAVFMKPP